MAIDYVYGDNAILNKRVVRVVQKDKKEKVVSDKVYTFVETNKEIAGLKM